MLEMIEILKVKREFLYLLLTLTQEKNVKVSRFPLIHLDETILAHTNLAEFHKFLQEKENEALLDRMVIIKVPYTLSYQRRGAHLPEARLERAGVPRRASRSARAATSRRCSRSSRACTSASTRGSTCPRSCGCTPAKTSKAFTETEAARMRAKSPDEGLTGVSPRFVINAISNAITRSDTHEPDQHGGAARAEGCDRDRCAHGCEARSSGSISW